MDRAKEILDRLLGWCPLYWIAVGGYRYYAYSQERKYRPKAFLHCGEGVRIGEDVVITAPEKVYLGDGVRIGEESHIYALGGFHIGHYSGMGERCYVVTVEHHYVGAEAIPFGEARLVKPVYIEDYVWIGANVSICPGVRIGEGAIVGLGTVVTKDVPSCAIVMGNPAQVIGHRNKEDFYRLKAEGAVRPFRRRRTILWVPPLTLRKYASELSTFGFDACDGKDFFEYKDNI